MLISNSAMGIDIPIYNHGKVCTARFENTVKYVEL
jgi:hypothetical protein